MRNFFLIINVCVVALYIAGDNSILTKYENINFLVNNRVGKIISKKDATYENYCEEGYVLFGDKCLKYEYKEN